MVSAKTCGAEAEELDQGPPGSGGGKDLSPESEPTAYPLSCTVQAQGVGNRGDDDGEGLW